MKLLPSLTRRLLRTPTARAAFSSFIPPSPLNRLDLEHSLAGGSFLKALVAENPYTDVVQYHHQNRTFTIQDVERNAEALAIGIAENGLIAGDVLLSYLPEHFNEQVRSFQKFNKV